MLTNTLPVTPGGIGIAEGASVGLYALIGQAGGANGMLLTRFFIVIHAMQLCDFRFSWSISERPRQLPVKKYFTIDL